MDLFEACSEECCVVYGNDLHLIVIASKIVFDRNVRGGEGARGKSCALVGSAGLFFPSSISLFH